MNEEIIIIMEIMAFISFLAASKMAFSNFKKTRELSNLWLLVTISLFLVSISCLIYAIGIYFQSLLNTMNIIRDLFLIIASTLLFSAIVSCQKEDALIKDGLNGNIKERDGRRFKRMKEWLKMI